MELPAELQGWAVLGVVIASAVTAVLAYIWKRPEPKGTEIRGAAIVDSSVGRGIEQSLESIAQSQATTAKATLGIFEHLVREQQERRDAELDALRREVSDLRRHRQP